MGTPTPSREVGNRPCTKSAGPHVRVVRERLAPVITNQDEAAKPGRKLAPFTTDPIAAPVPVPGAASVTGIERGLPADPAVEIRTSPTYWPSASAEGSTETVSDAGMVDVSAVADSQFPP